MLDDSKYTSLLAMVAVAAVPIIGVWEIFRQDESPSLRTFRLIVVLAFGLFLAVLILLRERLTKARLKSDAKKLESLNSELLEMVRAVLRRADPRSFRSTDDSKYTSLLALVAVVMVPAIGIEEVLLQNENPSLQTFHLLVVLVFGLLLAVLAFLGERLTRASLKSDSEKLEALNSELVEMVRAVLRRADPNTFRTTFVNKHVEDILGYPVESWLQDPSFWAKHLHPEDRERILAVSTTAIQERRNHDLEYRMIAANGRTIWLREIVNVIVENGVPTGLVGVSADISARKEAEESMTLFRKLIDGSTDAIEVLDPRTLHFLDINEKACRDLGYQRQEMLSMNVYDIDPTLDRSAHRCVTEKFRESGSVIMETLHRRKDGSTFPVEINVKYVPLDQGYVVAVVRDISARKRTEETLSTLNRRLIKEHEQERGRVARELRDDLNQRVALLQIRLGQFEQEVPDLPFEAREQLHSIAEVATNVSSSIHKLSHRLHPSLLDLVGLVPSVKGLCREFSDQHNLKVEFVHQDIPRQISEEVSLCLFRITQEALRNAAEHSGAAAARVELVGHEDRLELSISDSGAGFSLESAKKASGLGLLSMQERVRSVGGQLSVESEPSHGTRIRVLILRQAIDFYVDSKGVV